MSKSSLEKRLDKLVIQFNKALDMNVTEEQLPTLEGIHSLGGPWLTLGYFDTMQIYPLPKTQEKGEKSNCFKDIWNHSVNLSSTLNGHYYVHPFYIMADLTMDSKQEQYTDFWKREKTYLFVSLIQGAMLDGETWLDLANLEQRVCDVLEKHCGDVSYAIYHTLELSDLVVIWKSNSIDAVLRQLQILYRLPFIGDLNTFCGIDYTPLKKMYNPHEALEWTGKLPDEKATIPYVAMRLVTKDPEKPMLVFQELERYNLKPYFVTGTEDLHVIGVDIKDLEFCRMLHHCFMIEEHNSQFRKIFQEAFREVDTHVGIFDTPFDVEHDLKRTAKSQLTQCCQNLLNKFGKIRPEDGSQWKGCDFSWMKAVRNQLNELLDMSQNYVVDGLCFLALDSVSLFCERLQILLENRDSFTSKEVEEIQRFVRGWGILVEQAGRADGRFTHLPGFSPPLYDIPSTLLEFYLAFVKQCELLLQDGGSDSSEFAMLMVPKLCRRIKVETILNFEVPPCPRILYVDIPLDMLYDPFTVLCMLVHEISHFCGEIWRYREHRAEFFKKISAYELATILGMDTEEAVKEILKNIKEICKNGSNYLEDLKNDIYDAMEFLVKDDDTFSTWISLCEKSLTFNPQWEVGAWKNYCIANRAAVLNGYANGSLYQAIELIYELFRECYADVSMIRTLELDFSDYLNLATNELRLYKKWLKTGSDKKIEPKDFYVIVQRWTSVCLAVFGKVSFWKDPQEDNKDKKDECLIELYKHMENCAKYIESIDDQPLDSQWDNYELNAETLNQIVLYLKLCNNNMRRDFPCNAIMGKRLKELQEAFTSAARNHTIQCRCCRTLVSDYESRLLRKSYLNY